MPGTALSLNRVDIGWAAFSTACLGVMIAYPQWETVPFHLIWISLTLLYGFRVWSLPATAAVLIAVGLGTGASILSDAFDGLQLWGELFEVPLMSAMFVAMVWHARRRKQALEIADVHAEESAELLAQQERLLQNVSHELRTPVTIARGHLELLQRELGERAQLQVAFEELQHVEQIVDRLLLLARAERDGFLLLEEVALVPFLEDLFMRWAEVAPRAWRLGSIVDVTLTVDQTWLRTALDAMLENAVQYTDDYAAIELSARGERDAVVLEIADEGPGIPPDQTEQIFERFARADGTRREGGSGLGLAIVSAIARAHGGSVLARPGESRGTVFELRLPLPEAANAEERVAPGSASEERELPLLDGLPIEAEA